MDKRGECLTYINVALREWQLEWLRTFVGPRDRNNWIREAVQERIKRESKAKLEKAGRK